MVRYNLQFFGGRGANGPTLGKSRGKSLDIKSLTDVWSYRHNPKNEAFVDEINSGVQKLQDDYGDIMNVVITVSSAELGGSDKQNVLGFYGGHGLAINQNYTDIEKMNKTYDTTVKQGFHPSRGNLSGTQAVTLHEMGHALTQLYAEKMGLADIDAGAKEIVLNAYNATRSRLRKKAKAVPKHWAGRISGYASESYAEAVAEAVADYYCNGTKAKAESHAIIDEIKKAFNNKTK